MVHELGDVLPPVGFGRADLVGEVENLGDRAQSEEAGGEPRRPRRSAKADEKRRANPLRHAERADYEFADGAPEAFALGLALDLATPCRLPLFGERLAQEPGHAVARDRA